MFNKSLLLFLCGFIAMGLTCWADLVQGESRAFNPKSPKNMQPTSERGDGEAFAIDQSNWKWHMDEVLPQGHLVVKINGELHYLWRAIDHEGEVLECYVTKRRNKRAALNFLKKTMKKHGVPKSIVTDKLRSYGAALKELNMESIQNMDQYPHSNLCLYVLEKNGTEACKLITANSVDHLEDVKPS